MARLTMNTEATTHRHQPLISIVTVVLNGEHVIEQTMRSVIAQKDNTVEYIVIDGGSKDGTVAIIKKYGQHIDHWVSEPDRGVYDAMNKGIKVARGHCIGLLNSGDYYEPDTLSIVRKQLDVIPDRHFVVAGGIHRVDEFGVVIDTFHVDDAALRKRFSLMPLNHPAMFVSSSVYADIGVYNPERKISSDYEFVLALLHRSVKMYLLPRVLTNMPSGGLSERPKMLLVRLQESFQVRRRYKGRAYCLMGSAREVASFLWHFAKIKFSLGIFR